MVSDCFKVNIGTNITFSVTVHNSFNKSYGNMYPNDSKAYISNFEVEKLNE